MIAIRMMNRNLTSQEYFRSILEKRFAELRATTPSYSLRKFSEHLEQNPAAVSQILSGKRSVSKKFANRILNKMGCSPKVMAQVNASFNSETNEADAKDKNSLNYGRMQFDVDQYDLVAEWYYYGILSLALTKNFKSNPEWIADKLGVTKVKIIKALNKLEKLGLLNRDKKGNLKHSGVSISSTDGIQSLALRARHEENLNAAKLSILNDPLELRDFSFITVTTNTEKLAEARQRIRCFLNDLCDFLEDGPKDEVYELCVQLFPRTKKTPQKRKVKK